MGELAERALLPLKSEELRRKLGDAGREHERQNFAITKHVSPLIVQRQGFAQSLEAYGLTLNLSVRVFNILAWLRGIGLKCTARGLS